ncbi:MAG TPA: HAMP domain-containing sensor histidine kinase [Chitinophagaceae bacterium]
MKNRLRISLVLMLVSMILLAAFQGWWLYKSYGEEKETMNIRTSVLFRETLFRMQASKLRLDTNIRVALPNPSNAAGVINVLRESMRDSLRVLPGRKSTMIVSVDQSFSSERDTAATFIRRHSRDQVFDVLMGSESADDTLQIDEIKTLFSRSLNDQDIDVPYKIIRTKAESSGQVRMKQQFPGPVPDVTIGFLHPVTYKLQLGNTFPYLLGKIWPQILFAFFLMAVTVVSFLTLYRSLLAQRKLAGIKNDFISNMTHELKTPIATVSVAIEALKNFNAIDDPQKTKEYLDISQNELQRLSLLVDKVLKLSMFENKAIELKPELVDLKNIVEEVAASMRLQLEKYKAQLSIEAEGSTTLAGDKLHLTSVVFNLVDNALKYSKAFPTIRIEIREADGLVEMVIIDNGIGIAPEYKERIFEKFFRVPAGDTHNAKGYGLGLSYVAHVVQKHNGSIEVESQPGIGSRFTIKLPKSHE